MCEYPGLPQEFSRRTHHLPLCIMALLDAGLLQFLRPHDIRSTLTMATLRRCHAMGSTRHPSPLLLLLGLPHGGEVHVVGMSEERSEFINIVT